MSKPLLYCVLAHNSPKQTMRLLRAIYNERDQFVIHVDQSATGAYRALVAEVTQGLPNCRMISTRTCSWGGFSLVYATLDMLRIGLATSPAWSHAVMLSATHLPLWTLERFREWLPPGRSLLAWHGCLPSHDEWQERMKLRIEFDYREQPGVGMIRGEPVGPPEFRYYKGPQWNVLARHHVRYVVQRDQDKMFQRLSRSDVADESFFQTLLMNSHFAGECENTWFTGFVWDPKVQSPEALDYAGYRAAVAGATRPFIRKIAEEIPEEEEMKALIEEISGNAPHPRLLENIERAGRGQ